MRILFISKELIAGNLALLLKKEGHTVRLYIEDPNSRDSFDLMIEKVSSWKLQLKWVGKKGLIIFDDTGFGEDQDTLRSQGYTVVGGSALGELLETDRAFGQKIFKECGMQTAELHDFKRIGDAITFVRKNGGAWVIKQNGPQHEFNYIGEFEDGSDTIQVLENYRKESIYPNRVITLHRRVYGIELGVARYFNGHDWVGPIEMSVEHKRLFPGDLGPTTSEMGTLAWYDDDEKNKLFNETLEKMKPFLQKANFRGDMSVNCIVNKEGAFPVEATARFGCPIIHAQTEIQSSPWGDFLYAVASGKLFDLKWKKGYALVALIATPPFPYHMTGHPMSSRSMPVIFTPAAMKSMESYHFEEVALRTKGGKKEYYVSDDRGYTLYVTAMGNSISAARELLQEKLQGVYVPKMFYRKDLGVKFEHMSMPILKRLGYI